MNLQQVFFLNYIAIASSYRHKKIWKYKYFLSVLIEASYFNQVSELLTHLVEILNSK